MPVLCHASYCVHCIVESLWCVVFSLAIDVTMGFSAWGPKGPLGAVGLVALLLLGVYTHFFPFTIGFSSWGSPNIRNCILRSSFSYLKFPSPFWQNSPGTHHSTGLLGKKRTGNALSGCRSHTFSGNLNNPPHRFFLSLTLFLSASP